MKKVSNFVYRCGIESILWKEFPAENESETADPYTLKAFKTNTNRVLNV